MQSYSVTNNEEILPFVGMWMNLEDMPSEINQKDKISVICKFQKKNPHPQAPHKTSKPNLQKKRSDLGLVEMEGGWGDGSSGWRGVVKMYQLLVIR